MFDPLIKDNKKQYKCNNIIIIITNNNIKGK